MNVNTLKEKLKQNDQLQLIDIREPYEYEDGHISNINIPLCQVMEKIDQFDTSKEIILYCNSGRWLSKMARPKFLKC